MAVTIQHLNSDASFLFTFEPKSYQQTQVGPSKSPKPFRILLDPWVTGPAKLIHPKIARATHRQPPCILSLLELPEPNLVIISHHSSKHCNGATLRQLPAIGTKTIILATPVPGSKIKSWKYFEKSKVRILPKWEPSEPVDPKEPYILRFAVPPIPPGEPGEVTVAFIPQKHDLIGLHYAIGITYRAPSPPVNHLPLPPRFRSKSQISLRTTKSIAPSQQEQHPSPPPDDRPISLLYVPHGISYSATHSYVTNHLVSEAALPLTALLHPFNTTPPSRPLFRRKYPPSLPGSEQPATEIALKLGAKTWISAHDGDLVHRGIAGKLVTKRRTRNRIPEAKIKEILEAGGGKTAVVTLESGQKTVLPNTSGSVEKSTSTTTTTGNAVTCCSSPNSTEDRETENQAGEQEQKQKQKQKQTTESENPEEEEEEKEGFTLLKTRSSSETAARGRHPHVPQQQPELAIGSLEKCNWRSNLELFLQKDNNHGGKVV